MAESILKIEGSREEQYKNLLPQVKALLAGESNTIANMANVAAALKETFNFFWIGFYLVENDELVLGPFQGPVACTRIPFGKGVCGTSWKETRIVIVEDVDQFPGHIACSSLSKSEIVVPVFKDRRIVAVLDVDSTNYADFNETDAHYLKEICGCLF
jgi:L-methionine (R)-S-oxide reductase